MARLNIHSNILAFGDADTVTSNPKLRHVDWTTDFTQIRVSSPENKEFELAPAETRTLFSGARTLTVDGTTEFTLTASALNEGVYRLTATDGTAAGFRTARAITIGAESVIVAINNNATATFSLAEASTPTFAAAAVGDILFIPDTTTGDSASPFNVLNVGFWVILAKGPVGAGANRRLTCRRLPGASFEGTAETVAVAADAEFRVFSSGAVQVGDYLALTAGFSTVTQQTFQISAVTDSWVEFTSSESLPLEADIITGSAGINIYSGAKSFVRVEVDQPAVIRLNGATGDEVKLMPRVNGDLQGRAHFEMWGPIWQLVVVNRSPTTTVVVQLISAAEAV